MNNNKQEEEEMNKKIYVVICVDYIDASASIDEDCVFLSKEDADKKCRELLHDEELKDLTFVVEEIENPTATTETTGENEIAEAISRHADAMYKQAEAFEKIADQLEELVIDLCSADCTKSSGPTHPTIIVKEGVSE